MISSNTLRSAMGTIALAALAIAAIPADAYAQCAARQMEGGWRSPVQATTKGIVYLEITFPCDDTASGVVGNFGTTAPSTPKLGTIRVWARCGGALCDWGERDIHYRFWSETAAQYTSVVATYDFGWAKKTLRIFLLEDGRLWVFSEVKFTDESRQNYSMGEYFIK
jgi:hypothetical protein